MMSRQCVERGLMYHSENCGGRTKEVDSVRWSINWKCTLSSSSCCIIRRRINVMAMKNTAMIDWKDFELEERVEPDFSTILECNTQTGYQRGSCSC